jgi:small basic protein
LEVVEIGIRLKHRNVAQVLGIMWDEGVPAMIFPYLENVRAYIGRTLGVDLLPIVSSLCSGVAASPT